MKTDSFINERFLHYVWQHQLFDTVDLRTVDGESLSVLFPGYYNIDAGPDFKQAIVQIGDLKWVGNVEIHIRSSDWLRHHHQYDAKYRSVTLHVVNWNDTQVERVKGEYFPTLELQRRIPPDMFQRYQQLMDSTDDLPCRSELTSLNLLTIKNLLSSLSMERLLRKQSKLNDLLQHCAGDWHEVVYRMLAIGFGFKTNASAFELLAQELPYKLLAKHLDSVLQVEAMIFGQAGFLQYPSLDDYYDQLKYEYDYLRYKYQLSPIAIHQWNLLRMRPQNFPSVRLAQFSRLLCKLPHLFDDLLRAFDVEDLRKLLVVVPNDYWRTHYHFGCDTILEHSVSLGESAINLLILNTVIPMKFAFHQFSGNENELEQDVALLEQLPFEHNRVTRIFASSGFPQENAQDSQALIELHGQYCIQRRCLECAVGDCIVRNKRSPPTIS